MKGANALPAVSEIATPRRSNRRMSGRSQNFFRILRKPHISFRIDAYLNFSPPNSAGFARCARLLPREPPQYVFR
jgi:hypothetical protein